MQYLTFSSHIRWTGTGKKKGKYFHLFFKTQSGLSFNLKPKDTDLQRLFLETPVENKSLKSRIF